ncbi:glutathione S-transferase family protein [Neotabrizicola sp. VNH66]|uniref:glutathione S-transferase family protein n=1 Tax=Neotabrizicola sp. VNH66 TaxID=3400918 RepID=UPI003BFDF7AA
MVTKLWCFGESGNAYKVALMLTLTGAEWEPVHLDFFAGAARSPAFREINPMGEAPVLEIGTRRLTQSAVMLRHLAKSSGQFGWTSEEEEDEILRWLFWDNHKLSTQVGTTRFLMNFLPAEKRPAEAIAFLQGRIKAAFAVLNDHLASRDWVVADRPTIADLSLCGYLYYPEPFGFDRADWPHIDRWLDRIAALPGWQHPYSLMRRAFPPAA